MPRGGLVENRRIRINRFIRAEEVRLIDSDGTMMGVLKTVDALMRAQAKGLDLVEISPQAIPPVCKIISFTKFKYKFEKKEKGSKKRKKTSYIKEVRIRPRIEEHDLRVKINRARGFITNGYRVQLTAIFSGREMQYRDSGIKVIDKIKESLSDVAESEGSISSIGTRMFLILAPKKKLK